MSKKLLLTSLMAVTLSACSNMNPMGVLQVGSTLFQAASISDADVKALGAQSAAKLDAENKIATSNSKYSQRLNRITKNLRSYNGQPMNFKVYMNNDMNAFALPNGDIRVYSGLLDKMTDDEVLFVVGHEMGHVVYGHSKSQMRSSLLTTAARQAAAASGNSIVASLSSGQIGNLAHKLIDAQYSQSDEYEADAHGLKVLKENGRSKDAAVSALRKIAAISGGQSTIFSSHPDSDKRAERIANMN
ncbi:peptidase [Pelistega indica]|uniref:Peptidase n=1 Tax=Pelistega indica TaxID=1414851 RepID=V8GAD2_9BURK|nr:M48 family metallopeptidase [Pelistega indica]ETD73066.1 peptidase [Pelistega indica]